jgi:uncharacterized glyoxalase superfamily protein PhnB
MYKNITPNLMVESVDETVSFYKGILGFDLVTSVPSENGELQFALLSKGSLMLMFQEKCNLIKEYPLLNTAKVQPSITLFITVDNFDTIFDELKHKHKILCDIHTTFYGSREFAIADNNGYVLTFTEHKEG